MGPFMLPAELVEPFRELQWKKALAPTYLEAIRIAWEKKGSSPTFDEVSDVYREYWTNHE